MIKGKVSDVVRNVDGSHPDGGRWGDIDCSKDVPIVKQEFAEDCDVNVIIARCLRNGAPLPVYETIAPVFADVSSMGDLRDAMDRVEAVRAAFMELEAPVRRRFGNDPILLGQFLADPANRDEAVKLGLVVPPKAAEVPKVEGKAVEGTGSPAK